MKVLLLSNQARSMAVFWRVLIGAMRKRGMEAVCCVPPGDPESDAALAQLEAKVIHYDLDRKGLNPFRDLRSFMQLRRIFAAEKPDLLFATTIKPVIYGLPAARMAGVPKLFATITGLGYAFERDSLPKKILNRITRLLYRASLGRASGIFFQNKDDAALFREQGILGPDAPVLFARGTGVDTVHFAPAPLPAATRPTFLLVCRLLEAKGIADYAEAARILKKDFPDAVFQLLGPPESGPGAIDRAHLRAWQDEGLLEYLGETRDIRPFLANAHVAVLPSWREGLPTFLMEAMSMARALVATDVAGCREVVERGVNGFLAEARNPESLAAAMRRFLVEPALAERLGAASRRLAVEKFDAQVVAAGILNDMIGVGR